MRIYKLSRVDYTHSANGEMYYNRYSEYTILSSFAWYFERDKYKWNIENGPLGYNERSMRIASHWKHSKPESSWFMAVSCCELFFSNFLHGNFTKIFEFCKGREVPEFHRSAGHINPNWHILSSNDGKLLPNLYLWMELWMHQILRDAKKGHLKPLRYSKMYDGLWEFCYHCVEERFIESRELLRNSLFFGTESFERKEKQCNATISWFVKEFPPILDKRW